MKYDLFWNSASFQEMEPNVVLHYLKYVNQQTKQYVFLCEKMKGTKKTSKKGELGVFEQTKLEHYTKGLNNFKIINSSKNICYPRLEKLNSNLTFWKRK